MSCVLNNYEGACCQKFRKGGAKPAGGTTTAKPGGGDVPEKLDRAMIQAGVDGVRGSVMKCGDKSSSKGVVRLQVKVTADGSVSSASVAASPDPGLGQCAASAMQRARFKKTQQGGSFAIPFTFQ